MNKTARPILFAFFAAVISLLMAQPAQADTCTINWNTDASGAWNTAGNWDANRVPGGADHACINRPGADPQVTIPAGYTATLASLVNRDSALQLNGALVVTGTGSVLASPTVVDRCTGVLDVNAGATLDLEGEAADFSWSNYCSSALLKVSGTLNKTGGGTSSFAAVGVDVRGGVLNAVNGTLSVGGGANLEGASLNAGISGTLGLDSGILVSGTVGGTGSGVVRLNSTLYPTGTRAALNFAPGLFVWAGEINAYAAPITNTGGLSIPAGQGGNVCGTLHNTGSIDVYGLLVQDTRFTHLYNAPAGVLSFHDDGGPGSRGDLSWGNCSVSIVENESGGRVFNAGRIVKDGPGDTQVINNVIDVTGGSIEVIAGAFGTGGSTNYTTIYRGATITVSLGATLTHPSGTDAYVEGTLTGGGAGQVVLAGRLRGYGAGGSLNFGPGLFVWAGEIEAYGVPITNTGALGISAGLGGSVCGTLHNTGSIDVNGVLYQDTRFTHLYNAPAGVLSFHDDGGPGSRGDLAWGNCSASIVENESGGRVFNAGRIVKDGPGNTQVINNFIDVTGGSIEVISGTFGTGGSTNYSAIYRNATIKLSAGASLESCGTTQVAGTLKGLGAGKMRVARWDATGVGGTLDLPRGMLEMSAACGPGGLYGVDAPLSIAGSLQFEVDVPLYGTVIGLPGAEFRGRNDSILSVQSGAFLYAAGTVTNPVWFVGDVVTPTQGTWAGINYLAGSAGSLANCVVRDGGDRINPLVIRDPHVSVTRCEFSGNNSPVRVTFDAQPELRNNGFWEGLTTDNSSSALVDARSNWWGHPTGPYHPVLNPGGLGSTVADNVVFDPWLSVWTLTGAADLRVRSISAPTQGAVGSAIPLTFVVENIGASLPVTVAWRDAIYASLDGVYDLDDTLLASITRTGGLTQAGAYTVNANVTLPMMESGPFRILVVADHRHVLLDANPLDNAASRIVLATVPELPLNGSVSGVLGAAGGLYRLTPNCQQDTRVTLNSAAAGAELLARALIIPTLAANDSRGNPLSIPPTCAVQYIRIQALQPGLPFMLSAQTVDIGGLLAIQSFSPTLSSGTWFPIRDVTVKVLGSGFSPTTTVTLRQPNGATLPPTDQSSVSQIIYKDSGTLYARVSVPMGIQIGGALQVSYTLALANGPSVALSAQTLSVIGKSNCVFRGSYALARPDHAQPADYSSIYFGFRNCVRAELPPLRVAIHVPASIRSEREFPVEIEYWNDSGIDLPAQVLSLNSENARYRFADERALRGASMLLFANNPDPFGPVDVIPAGARGTLHLIGQPTVGGAHVDVPQTVNSLSAMVPPVQNPAAYNIDVGALLEAFRPAGVTDIAWSASYPNLRHLYTTMTPPAFEAGLRALAAELATSGVRTNDVSELLLREVRRADEFGELSARRMDGAFGVGLPDITVMRVLTDVHGNRIVQMGPTAQVFSKLRGTVSWSSLEDPAVELRIEAGESVVRSPEGAALFFAADGLLRRAQDAYGNSLTVGYAGGKPVSYTSSTGDVVRLAYNGAGRVVSMTDAVGQVTTYGYAAGNFVSAITDVRGTTLISRSAAGARITLPNGSFSQVDYDANGRKIRESVNGGLEPVTYTYTGTQVVVTNGLGRHTVIDRLSANVATGIVDPLGQTMSAIYGPGGGATRIMRGSGEMSAFAYTAKGQPKRQVDTLGRSAALSYDGRGNLTGFGDARGNATRLEYTGEGALAGVARADGTGAANVFNPRGLLASATDRRGNAVIYEYTATDLLSRTLLQNGDSALYRYDARRNLTGVVEIKSGVSQTTAMLFDSANRLTRVQYPNGRLVQYAYDSAGNLTTLGDGTGFELRYSRTGAGRLAQIKDQANAVLVTYTYDAAGNLIREDRANGTAVTYVTDANGNVTQITHLGPGNAVQETISYVYDAAGRRAQMTTSAGVARYRYDAVGQLISATLPGGRTLTWDYDANGNRVAASDNAVPVGYASNVMNQYVDVNGAPAIYDPAGNLLSHAGANYTWSADGMLIGMSAPGETWQFEYDVFGNRSAAIRNGVRTEYLVDLTGNGNVLAEYDQSGTLIARYAHGTGLVARLSGAGAAFYGFDGSGNTLNMTNPSGAVVNRYRYLPFGEVLTSTETITNAFQFGGRYGLQRANGLVYARARYLRPDWGRFISEEPQKIVTINAYHYAHNNPVGYLDSDGLADQPMNGVKRGFKYAGWGQTALENGLWALDAAYQGFDYGIVKSQGVINAQLEAARDIKFFAALGGKNTAQNLAQLNKAADRGIGLVKTGAGVSKALRGVAVVGAVLTVGEALYDLKQSADKYNSSGSDEALADLTQTGFKGIAKSMMFAVPFGGPIVDGFVNIGDDVVKRGGAMEHMVNFWSWWETNPDPFGPSARQPGPHTHNPDQRTADDPNEMVGPSGSGPQGWVTDGRYVYTIRFENVPTATANAAMVFVTHTLDADLDPLTVELVGYGFGASDVAFDAPRTSIDDMIDVSQKYSVVVRITAGANALGQLQWRFDSIDPASGDTPLDSLLGFLPPNGPEGEGQGYVVFSAKAKSGAVTGAQFQQSARIFFDDNPPIDTNIHLNTLDKDAPSCAVNTLPLTSTTKTFNVGWAGSDIGSGLASYEVFTATAPLTATYLTDWSLWMGDGLTTTAPFTGLNGVYYSYVCVAVDGAGNVAAAPVSAQTSTWINVPLPYKISLPLVRR